MIGIISGRPVANRPFQGGQIRFHPPGYLARCIDHIPGFQFNIAVDQPKPVNGINKDPQHDKKGENNTQYFFRIVINSSGF